MQIGEEPQFIKMLKCIITHGMPLEILAVTFHTLVGDVISFSLSVLTTIPWDDTLGSTE